jgi:Glycosyltransferases involved in cell wall biogenesis
LFAIFVALPGRSRSPFSGIPFSSKAHALVVLILVLGLCLALFPARTKVRARWLIALIVLALLKAALGSALIEEGWRARYWTAHNIANPSPHLGAMTPVRFFRRGIHPDRIDRAIEFDGINFALFYVNDSPVTDQGWLKESDDITQPLRVQWTGYVNTTSPTAMSPAVTVNGLATVAIDGVNVFRGASPQAVSISRTLTPGTHRIDISYEKPVNETPAMSVTPWPVPVTPVAVETAALWKSRLAGYAIELLGLAALAVLFAALVDAYQPLVRFLLEDIWAHPDKVALVALVSLVLLIGLRQAVLVRGSTMPLGRSDDPRAYEGAARTALFNGPLMITIEGAPFYFYPLYSYALAGAHIIFGEDYGTIRFFNWSCLAFCLVLVWNLLRRWLSAGSLIIGLVVFWLFIVWYAGPYAHASFTDNLFLPMAVAVVLAATRAFEKRSFSWLLITGILTALGAATRPSLMIHAPIFFVTLLLFWQPGYIRRAAAAGAFAIGFAAGIAPFTIRNWIVAKKLVLLISSGNIMLPMFLYPPEQLPGGLSSATSLAGSLRLALTIFRLYPVHTVFVEVRKVLFTLGVTLAAPYDHAWPILLILFPIAFVVAVRTRRIPRPALIAISSFALSHLAAMIVATPWTYGYKTILPFHFALAVGAAFLLPHRGQAFVRDAIIPRHLSPGRKSVSVILPTYNERDSIRQVILDFFSLGVVDEVVVVNNNAAEGTSEQVAGTGAREVFEPQQGYGAATRRGLREATGDYIVICEPDGTFLARDILKLLAYADDFDVVYGSRTSQLLVWQGANMGLFLRIGNWAVAKYVQFLFNAPSLSDVGCTMRLLRRQVVEELANEFESNGSQFGPEMMVLTLRHNYRIVQIPVNYTERVGVSSVTGEPATAFLLGLQMIWLISRHRLRVIIENREHTPITAMPVPIGADSRTPLR